MREGSASWSKLGLGRGRGAGGHRGTVDGETYRLTPSTCGYIPADETLLVTGTFRLPTWRTGRAG